MCVFVRVNVWCILQVSIYMNVCIVCRASCCLNIYSCLFFFSHSKLFSVRCLIFLLFSPMGIAYNFYKVFQTQYNFHSRTAQQHHKHMLMYCSVYSSYTSVTSSENTKIKWEHKICWSMLTLRCHSYVSIHRKAHLIRSFLENKPTTQLNTLSTI